MIKNITILIIVIVLLGLSVFVELKKEEPITEEPIVELIEEKVVFGAEEHVYKYSDQGITHQAYWEGTGTDTPRPPGDAGYSEVAPTFYYDRLYSDDESKWGFNAGDQFTWFNQWFDFTIDEDVGDITAITTLFNGYDSLTDGDDFEFDIWDDNSSQWEVIYTTETPESEDQNYGSTISSNISNYLDGSNHLHLGVSGGYESTAASCAYIYVWNGTEYEFVSDIDVGKLGPFSYEGPNIKGWKWEETPFYVTPIPIVDTEFLQKINVEMQPRNGEYEIKYVEELTEVSYADLLELWTIDHRPSVEVYTDWTYRNNLYTVRKPRLPVSAVDHKGDDILSLISAKDDNAWASGWRPLPEDYKNLTIDEIVKDYPGVYITLKLGNWSEEEMPENLKLVITEVREKGKNLALKESWGSIKKYFKNDNDLPKLFEIEVGTSKFQIKNSSGDWIDAPLEYQKIEMPGNNMTRYLPTYMLPDTYVMNLSGLEIPGNEIRYILQGQKQFHVDQILVDTSASQDVDVTVLKPSSANLDYRGGTIKGLQLLSQSSNEYNYNYTYSENHFSLDYSNTIDRSPSQSGNLTRYGDVLPLILEIDDEMIIMGMGDELSLKFDYIAPAPGKIRDFVFREFGYYKPIFRATGDTVEPLPFKDMTMYPYDTSIENYDYELHKDYIENYQTREIVGNEHHTLYTDYIEVVITWEEAPPPPEGRKKGMIKFK